MEYVMFAGEKCELIRIVNSNACIRTDKGVRFVHISKIEEVPAEEPAEPDVVGIPNWDNMTKAQLIEYAEGQGIEIDKKAKKAEIIDVIANA